MTVQKNTLCTRDFSCSRSINRVLRSLVATVFLFEVISSLQTHTAGAYMLAPSVVTGASGFLGRAIVEELIRDSKTTPPSSQIYALVRSSKVSQEQSHWDNLCKDGSVVVKVLSYDMLDGGHSLASALKAAGSGCLLFHAASNFSPSENHVQCALDNIKGTEDAMVTAKALGARRVIFTSSMAAVRATNQPPKNGNFYTNKDWNTLSELGKNWGSSYQYSKRKSEERALELSKEMDLELNTVCPSFIFGPPCKGVTSTSYSITLVKEWMEGRSQVQSRLTSDIRDVAIAHVRAGRVASAGRRYIVASEARVPSAEIAKALIRSIQKYSGDTIYDIDQIKWDEKFDGGAIKIGQQEVACSEMLENELMGLTCRPTAESFEDMARAIIEQKLLQQE